MKQFTKNDKIYKKRLEDAIEYANNANFDTVNFIIGSFYTYGTVINTINNFIST